MRFPLQDPSTLETYERKRHHLPLHKNEEIVFLFFSFCHVLPYNQVSGFLYGNKNHRSARNRTSHNCFPMTAWIILDNWPADFALPCYSCSRNYLPFPTVHSQRL